MKKITIITDKLESEKDEEDFLEYLRSFGKFEARHVHVQEMHIGDDENDFLTDFAVDVLEFCGCIDGSVILDIWRVFKRFDREVSPYITNLVTELHFSYKYVHLILNVLDEKGLLEHGTAVRGSWLTDYGKDVLKRLKDLWNEKPMEEEI